MIKAGFQLVITSWENDGDNYKNVTISGLTEERARLLITICKKFTSTMFGNMYEGTEVEVENAAIAVVSIMGNNLEALEADELVYASEDICDYMANLLGYGEGYSFRTFDSYKVFYIPMDIEEVTTKFE